MRTISFPESTLRVTAFKDPVLERCGHDPRSEYAELYWLPILGPTSLLLMRRLTTRLDSWPDGFEIDTELFARELGVGMSGGKNGPMWRSVDRCCRFGAIKRNGRRIAVRTHLSPLTDRQVQRLPTSLQNLHRHTTHTEAATV